MYQPMPIFAFCGPSGSGKSELAEKLLSFYPEALTKWQQVTTRERRSMHDDYLFITPTQYKALEAGKLLTCRTHFNNNSYGTIPESVKDGIGVLTIVDIQGLTSLENDVALHNASFKESGSGLLGDRPVSLVKILVFYEITDETVKRRGREARGAQFILNELLTFKDVKFDGTVDTTNDWPDVVSFFESVIEPVLNNDAEFRAEFEVSVVAELQKLIDIVKCPSTPLDFLEDVHQAISKFIPEALTAAVEETDNHFKTNKLEKPNESDLPEETPEIGEAASAEPLADTTGNDSDTTAGKESSPVENARTIKAAAAKQTFQDWMLYHTIGSEAFDTINAFSMYFTQYLSSNSIDLTNLDFSVEVDSNQVAFTVSSLSTNERYAVTFDTVRRSVTEMLV